MTAATADIRTDWADRYLSQLCAQFADNRELAVSQRKGSGVIRFPAGDCVLHASADTLRLELDCRDATSLERLQEVINKHLTRFACRDAPVIEWRAS